MGISALAADERVADVRFDEHRIIVDLMDGRTVAAPLAWLPRLAEASPAQRALGTGGGRLRPALARPG